MYTQTNVVLLCCVGSVSNVAVPLEYGHIGARTDTTQQSGQTPDKEVEVKKKTLLFMLAATLKPIRLECYLPRLSAANKLSLFRADSLARYLLQCAHRIRLSLQWTKRLSV